ncbi:hypothetical protein Taro_046057 [Colocasia esculenta]|uniref:Uncharacterized protein n=1 Tax=Colocasia esculenta TaxID=4460 RepID=A0A843X538_COLES|nr:hypothetical protein [Colocasia esculenta]
MIPFSFSLSSMSRKSQQHIRVGHEEVGGLQSSLFLWHVSAPLILFQQRALRDAMLATATAQTCADLPLAFIGGPSASAPLGFLAGASTVPEAEDVVSLQEGGGSFYDGTLLKSNHQFMHPSDEARSRSIWTTTTRSNFKHLLYNVRENAQRVCQSPNPTVWRECALTWMRRDYWQSLCNIWAAERWKETSTTMKVNRVANPDANKHTSGSAFFATHQSRLEKELKQPPTF